MRIGVRKHLAILAMPLAVGLVVVGSVSEVSGQTGGAAITAGDTSTWQSSFAASSTETTGIGDFNGDGVADVVSFTRDSTQAPGDVLVALSDRSGFESSPKKWADSFAGESTQDVVIGDFNGDGKDDVAAWLRASTDQVYVGLSTGSSLDVQASPWLADVGNVMQRFPIPNARDTDAGDLMYAGDVDGDGDDDLALFARSDGDVYVALSNRSGFDNPKLWHDFFAVSTFERPRVGDVDGDGKADIITFATDSPTAFGDGALFVIQFGTQQPAVAHYHQ